MNISSDPKEYTIRVRLNEKLNNYLKDRCRRRNTTVSAYIRDLIEKDRRHSAS